MDYTYFSTHPYGGGLPPPQDQGQQAHADVFNSSTFLPFESYPFTNQPQNPPGPQVPHGIPPLPPPHPQTTNSQPQPQSSAAVSAAGPGFGDFGAHQRQQQYSSSRGVFEPSPSDVSSSARTGDGPGSGSGISGNGMQANDTMMAIDDEQQPSSEEKAEDPDTASLTPAQSKRKAQNRAAQRAFRERKEKRVRDLEDELKQFKENVSSLVADNDSLKRQIARLATENEILRATVHGGGGPGMVSNNGAGVGDGMHDKEEQVTMGPLKYSPMDYKPRDNGDAVENNNIGNNNAHANGGNTRDIKKEPPTITHRVKVSETTGEKLLDASATWGLIVSHRSDANVTLDVQDIYERLKGRTQCDGQQPVIEEAHVRKAIRDSATAARAELL